MLFLQIHLMPVSMNGGGGGTIPDKAIIAGYIVAYFFILLAYVIRFYFPPKPADWESINWGNSPLVKKLFGFVGASDLNLPSILFCSISCVLLAHMLYILLMRIL